MTKFHAVEGFVKSVLKSSLVLLLSSAISDNLEKFYDRSKSKWNQRKARKAAESKPVDVPPPAPEVQQ